MARLFWLPFQAFYISGKETKVNNTKITDWLREGKEEKAFSKLYSLFPKVEKYICLNSGSKDEALDIFQEGLILLDKKSEQNKELHVDGF